MLDFGIYKLKSVAV